MRRAQGSCYVIIVAAILASQRVLEAPILSFIGSSILKIIAARDLLSYRAFSGLASSLCLVGRLMQVAASPFMEPT